MKDIIENRLRIRPSTKARLLWLSLKENGALWTGLMAVYYATSALAEKAFAMASARRRQRLLPGMNSSAMNKLIWENWDWGAKGEEWTLSADWKRSVIERLLRPSIGLHSSVVEIGPGGGRWTEELQSRAGSLVGIDLSEACIRECRDRFAHCSNTEFRVGSGSDLHGIADRSVDAIWSFDVFVHINRPEFRSYVEEFARVLKPGGVGVIQHGGVGGTLGGWRSDVTQDDVRDFLAGAGLIVVEQVSSWIDRGHEFPAGMYGDVLTTFRKPLVETDASSPGGLQVAPGP